MRGSCEYTDRRSIYRLDDDRRGISWSSSYQWSCSWGLDLMPQKPTDAMDAIKRNLGEGQPLVGYTRGLASIGLTAQEWARYLADKAGVKKPIEKLTKDIPLPRARR